MFDGEHEKCFAMKMFASSAEKRKLKANFMIDDGDALMKKCL